MDTDILAASKECLYDADLLDEFTQEYNGLSWLDVADASPSEILADAGLVPAISPVQSVKSSPNETCSSESSSDDDSKNGSRTSSGRKLSQSPFDWNSYNEPTNELKLEDIELFLQKSVPNSTDSKISEPPVSCRNSDKTRPVMAIENGVIKVVRKESNCEQSFNNVALHKGTAIHHPNSIFKVVNENGVKRDGNVQVVVEKRLPRILRPANISFVKSKNVVTPKEGKISILPISHNKPIHVTDSNGYNAENPQTRSAVISPSNIHQTSKQQSIKEGPKSPVLDFSNFTDAEIRAFKKQQRMIKNRESACQSRLKKKEYVTGIEQQLLKAHQEIARLRLENKLLRDQLETNTRSRKIPRLDSSILIHKKNIAVIFAMVFMVSLNWNVLGWNTKSFSRPSETHINSRHLLWSDETMSSDYDSYNRSAELIDCHNATLNDFLHINQTESIRIVGELKRWIGSGKTLNWTNTPKKQKVYVDEEQITGGLLETYRLFNKLNIDNNIIDLSQPTKNGKTNRDKSRLKRLRRNSQTDKDMFPYSGMYYDRLYKKIRKPDEFNLDDFGEWNALLQALHRRDDTFYVVGVGKGEHLLLPAVTHNVTRPPKMALILPAKSGNDSLMNDHVTLMQIDCSVVNTTLVKLKSNALPESLRKTNTDEKQYNIKSENKQVKRHKLHSSPSDMDYNISNVSKYIENSLGNVDNNEKNALFAQYLLSKSRNVKDSASKTDVVNDDIDKSNI